jgi:hypothetical protein
MTRYTAICPECYRLFRWDGAGDPIPPCPWCSPDATTGRKAERVREYPFGARPPVERTEPDSVG